MQFPVFLCRKKTRVIQVAGIKSMMGTMGSVQKTWGFFKLCKFLLPACDKINIPPIISFHRIWRNRLLPSSAGWPLKLQLTSSSSTRRKRPCSSTAGAKRKGGALPTRPRGRTRKPDVRCHNEPDAVLTDSRPASVHSARCSVSFSSSIFRKRRSSFT